jgi:hypothetical protein
MAKSFVVQADENVFEHLQSLVLRFTRKGWKRPTLMEFTFLLEIDELTDFK